MEGLSIEEKAKAYDKAIERAKDMLSYKEVRREDMEYLFPELKKSGDEKIRKSLVAYFAKFKPNDMWDSDFSFGGIVAWLEKQGEQKTTIEMKTPEESLGVDSNTYNKIVDECVYGEQKPIKEHNACEFCADRYGCVNPCSMKLIEEEKPADLPKGEDYDIDGLYAAIDILQKTLGEVDGYQTNDGILMHKCAISAVKELSKHKPAWSEEDVAMLDSAVAFVEHSAFTTIGKGKGGVVAWLKSLKDRAQPQKQEWSEEDKDILFRTINNLKFLRDTISIDPKYAINIIDIEREITWLNSLRPQNKTYYWTENEIKFAISDFIRGAESYEKMVEKLRCLKPQTTWKPSGEQMLAINTSINVLGKGTINGKYLIELHEQLKKLREE